MRRKFRTLLWRYRYVIATALITMAALLTIQQFRPAPPGSPVVVAAHELPAGVPISAEGVGVIALATPPEGIADDPVGLTPIVTIPAGVPVAESMLLGPGLPDHAPPGTVVAPVHVSDPSVLTLLRVGDRVDLYVGGSDFGGDDSGAELVSSGVRVIAVPGAEHDGRGLLGLDEAAPTMFFGAIPSSDASLFTGAGGVAPFRVVISSAQD